jgi:hypothetical protein
MQVPPHCDEAEKRACLDDKVPERCEALEDIMSNDVYHQPLAFKEDFSESVKKVQKRFTPLSRK